MIRDMFNYLGEKVGELDLPDSTSEEVWQEELTSYAQPPQKTEIKEVSPRQMRSALLLSGITPQSIVDAIGCIPSPQKELAMIAWEYSTSFDRNSVTVNTVGQMVGLTSDQLDQLWQLALSL